MAIEDAACLGIVFGKKHFNGDVSETLKLYERVRKPRATRVQAASARAASNIHERIGANACLYTAGLRAPLTIMPGFSSNTDNTRYSVQNEQDKLTIEEMNR